jgi:hypothetical protein
LVQMTKQNITKLTKSFGEKDKRSERNLTNH